MYSDQGIFAIQVKIKEVENHMSQRLLSQANRLAFQRLIA